MSCNKETQQAFNLAIALLYSFEYKESEKAFAKVIDADPECAMAYWGVARFNGIYGAALAAKQTGNREKARKYFEKLMKLSENSNSDRPEISEAKAFLGRTK